MQLEYNPNTARMQLEWQQSIAIPYECDGKYVPARATKRSHTHQLTSLEFVWSCDTSERWSLQWIKDKFGEKAGGRVGGGGAATI